jgi:hypothetical protein
MAVNLARARDCKAWNEKRGATSAISVRVLPRLPYIAAGFHKKQ